MKLIPNWWAVLTRAWSNRFAAVAVLFGGIDAATPYLYGVLPIPDRLFALLAAVASMAAIVARHLPQGNLKDE
ncbi:hypothetical protein D3227_25760 [Mesorhizobium waimense]|uniref:Uncharacterized protein n=1 Tax=Mesorhizobium waimense TaxID=1300307 RepID=A0A3A5KC73_9HYPH|nr:hypothetical protein [Mesorhizobium waimense]RJT32809.1 hypothetical protein D3227_25760 [Mesorhizobium waimense]